MPISFRGITEYRNDTGLMIGTTAVIAEEKYVTLAMAETGATAVLQRRWGVRVDRLGRLAALLADGGIRDVGYGGIGLNDETVDDEHLWAGRLGYCGGHLEWEEEEARYESRGGVREREVLGGNVGNGGGRGSYGMGWDEDDEEGGEGGRGA